MTLKLIICGLILAISLLASYFFSEKYRRKKIFYEQFCLFHERYLAELDYTKRNVKEFLSKEKFASPFQEAVEKFPDMPDREKTKFLTEEENRFFRDYFSRLGKGDSFSQKGYFQSQTAELTRKKQTICEESKKKCDLMIKLGLLVGLAIDIIII